MPLSELGCMNFTDGGGADQDAVVQAAVEAVDWHELEARPDSRSAPFSGSYGAHPELRAGFVVCRCRPKRDHDSDEGELTDSDSEGERSAAESEADESEAPTPPNLGAAAAELEPPAPPSRLSKGSSKMGQKELPEEDDEPEIDMSDIY